MVNRLQLISKKLVTSVFVSATLLFSGNAFSQSSALSGDESGSVRAKGEPYTLQESVDYALKNNVQLRQSQLTMQNNLNTLESSRWLKYPTVNGFFGGNGNFGRNVDPFSNSIVTQAIGTNNMGVRANAVLYDGYRIKNTVVMNELNLSAAKLDYEALKNTISLNVANAYLNVLSTEDLIEVSQKQVEVTKFQLERTQKLIDGGSLAEANLFDLDAQLANDELQLVNAINNHESAILTLKQVMNMPIADNISVVRVEVADPTLQPYPETAAQVYAEAISYLPEVKAANTRIEAALKNVEMAQALGQPTVSVNGTLSTAYSSVAKRAIAGEETFQQVPVSATFDGQTIPFVLNLPQQNFTRENIPYFNQLGNNQSTNIGVSVSIPIFNGYNTKFQTEGAKIQKLQADLQAENTKLTIRQNIDQAFISMLNAGKSYTATLAQVRALEKSFTAAESRYNAGSSNFIDYNLAKTRLDQAAANLIQSKYNYIFRIKILDFYQNKPLNF